MTATRGDLHYADLSQIGRKLVLVLSDSELNRTLRQPVICLVTSQDRERSLPTYVVVDPPEGGVTRTSYILCHALLTVEDWRLDTKPIGTLTSQTLERVEAALRRALSL